MRKSVLSKRRTTMNITGIGGSSTSSILYHIGEHRKALFSDHVAYASRSGALGHVCDVTDPDSLQKLFYREFPRVVILAVGTALQNPTFATFSDWQRQRDDIAARSFGALATMIAAHQAETVRQFIVLGGRETFEDPNLGAYAASNGATWGLIQHANRHTHYDAWYVDMPFVIDSANAETLRAAGLHTGAEIANAIRISDVVRTADEILSGQHLPGRIILGNTF